jgi:hypothetical protein
MTEAKRKQLIAAARRVPPLDVPSGLGDKILRAIRNEEGADLAPVSSVMEQMAALFPRVATAALVIIVAAAAFEFFAGGDVALQLTEASDQWLLPLDWL